MTEPGRCDFLNPPGWERARTPFGRRGFTIIEILMVVVILAIISSIAVVVYRGFQQRAEVVKCMSHMRGLHQFASLYIGDHATWPYPDHVEPDDTEAWGRAWQELTAPYDLTPDVLVCPTHQKGVGNPDLNDHPRIDYMATPFSGGRWAPYRYARQPWFLEVGDFHGKGNLVIFPDGHIESLSDLAIPR